MSSAINIADAPRSEITIAGLKFTVPAPFTEGHVLRPNEAAVLNQTYAENLRNNFASAVRKAAEEAQKTGAQVDVEALQSSLDKYVEEYDFGVRRAGGTRAPVDPVEREAMNIARQKVRDALKKKGYKISDISKERIDELASQVLEQHPQIREHAKRVVAVKQEVGSEALDIEA